jgi:4-diphosphocytidyl-2-C-methyl-D-erythritol kinase
MLRFPNAKINIGLNIVRKRPDGYHDLETVFYPVPVHDALEILPATSDKETRMYFSGLPVVGPEEENLVWKALRLLQGDFPQKIKTPAVYLHKSIPMGAGLGGGSADAAFMLQLMNDYFELELNKELLLAYALKLGSDCPFFIENRAVFAEGRGEVMKPVTLDLSPYNIQIICPALPVSTATAFQTVWPRPSESDLRTIVQMPIASWKAHIRNDFEAAVFPLHPELAAIKAQLYQQGALYAALSGSGSALYGIFPKEGKAIIKTRISFQEFYV